MSQKSLPFEMEFDRFEKLFFQKDWQNLPDLIKAFDKERLFDLVSRPLSELFNINPDTIEKQMQQYNLTKFDREWKPFTTEQMTFINKIVNTNQVPHSFVIRVLNELIETTFPPTYDEMLKKYSSNDIDFEVTERWMEGKKSYLRGLVLYTAKMKTLSLEKVETRDLSCQALKNNMIFESQLENLRYLSIVPDRSFSTPKLTHYYLLQVLHHKELVLRCVHNIFLNYGLGDLRWKLVKEFLHEFGNVVWDCKAEVIVKNLKFNMAQIGHLADRMVKRLTMTVLITFVAMFAYPFRRTELSETSTAEIDYVFEALRDNFLEMKNLNVNNSNNFILWEIYQVYLLTVAGKSNNPVQVKFSKEVSLYNGEAFENNSPIRNFNLFLDKLKETFAKDAFLYFRWSLKALLNVLSMVAQRDRIETNRYFSNKNEFLILYNRILGEVLQKNSLAFSFCAESNSKEPYLLVMEEILNNYPNDTDTFMDTLHAIAGSMYRGCMTFLVQKLSNMNFITLHLNEILQAALVEEPQKTGVKTVKITGEYDWKGLVNLKPGMIGKYRPDDFNAIEFSYEYNFFAHIYKILLTFIYKPNQHMTEDIIQLIVFLCKIIIVNPTVIYEMHEKFLANSIRMAIGKPTDTLFPVSFVLMMIQLISILEINQQNPAVHSLLFRALAAVMHSEAHETSVFVIKLTSILRPAEESFEAIGSYFIEMFLKKLNEKPEPEIIDELFKGVEAILKITRILFGNEVSWLEYEANFKDFDQSRIQTEKHQLFVQEYQSLLKNAQLSEVEKIDAIVCDFFSNKYLNKQSIYPFNYESYFTSIVLKIGHLMSKETFFVSSENIDRKYNLYAEYMSLLTTFFSRIQFEQPIKTIESSNSLDFSRILASRANELIMKLPLNEIFVQVFMLRENTRLPREVLGPKHLNLPIINRHLFNCNNSEILNEDSSSVQSFLINSLDCVSAIIRLCTTSNSGGEEGKYADLKIWLKNVFLNRESMFKGVLFTRPIDYSVNVVFSIFLILINKVDELEENKIKSKLNSLQETINDCSIRLPSMWSQENLANDIFYFDDRWIHSCGLIDMSNQRKCYTIASAAFRTLKCLMSYWSSNITTQRHLLTDLFAYTEISDPAKEIIAKNIAYEIKNQILAKNVEVLEFLIECNSSQADFVHEMMKHSEISQKNTNLFLMSLKQSIHDFSSQAREKELPVHQKSMKVEIAANFVRVVLGLIENSKLKTTYIENIWNGLFLDVCDLFIKVWDFSNQNLVSLTLFGTGLYESPEKTMNENIMSRAVIFLRLHSLLDKIKLVDITLIELMQKTTTALFKHLRGGNLRFISDYATEFIVKLFNLYTNFQNQVISKEVIAATSFSSLFESSVQNDISMLKLTIQNYWNPQKNLVTNQKIEVNFRSGFSSIERLAESKNMKIEQPPTNDKSHDFNPLFVYFDLTYAGCPEPIVSDLTEKLKMINVFKSVTESKKELKNAFLEFISLMHSLGIRGVFLGQKMEMVMNQSVSETFLKRLNFDIKSKEKEALPRQHSFLTDVCYNIPILAPELIAPKRAPLELNLARDIETQLMNPLHTAKYRLPFNYTHIFKKNYEREPNEKKYFDLIDEPLSRVRYLAKIAYFCVALNDNVFRKGKNLKLDLTNFKTILKLIHLQIEAANHILVHNPEINEEVLVNYKLKGREFFNLVDTLSIYVKDHPRIKSDTGIVNLVEDMYMSFYLFAKMINLKEVFNETELIFKSYLQRKSHEIRRYLPVIAYMAELFPKMVTRSEINVLAKLLVLDETTPQEIISILQIFNCDYFKNPEKIDVYAESELLGCLTSMPFLDRGEEWMQAILYRDKRVTKGHAVWVHLLNFLTNFAIVSCENSLAQKKLIGFFTKYRFRFEKTLGLMTMSFGEELKNIEFSEEAYTLAFLEELQGSLAFLRALCTKQEMLVGQYEQLFIRLYNQLFTQTVRFVSTEILTGHQKTNRGLARMKVAELFRPVSIFEGNIDQVPLMDFHSQPSKTENSGQPAEEHKPSFHSGNLANHKFEENALMQKPKISSLLLFIVEVKLLEIAFLSCDLFRLMVFGNPSNAWRSVIWNRERGAEHYCFLATVFYDVQVYLKNYFSRIASMEMYSEGLWHMALLKRSETATAETLGTFQAFTVYSYEEIKSFVRRSFELAIFGQRLATRCFLGPFYKPVPETTLFMKKRQEESSKTISEFLKYENFVSQTKNTVSMNRSRRELSGKQEQIRPINEKQGQMMRNLSILPTKNSKSGQGTDEIKFFDLHKKAINSLKIELKL